MNSVRLPREPARMRATIFGSCTRPSRGGPIRSALFACGTAKAGTVREARSICMRPCRSTPGGYTFLTQTFFGRGGDGDESNGEDTIREPEKNLGVGWWRYPRNFNRRDFGTD